MTASGMANETNTREWQYSDQSGQHFLLESGVKTLPNDMNKQLIKSIRRLPSAEDHWCRNVVDDRATDHQLSGAPTTRPP